MYIQWYNPKTDFYGWCSGGMCNEKVHGKVITVGDPVHPLPHFLWHPVEVEEQVDLRGKQNYVVSIVLMTETW